MPSNPYSSFKPEWRDRLRALINEKGWSMRYVSMKAGLDPATVSEWLRDTGNKKPKTPSFPSLAMVAEVLGASLNEFTESTPEGKKIAGTAPALSAVEIGRASVLGELQAGGWKEAGMLQQEDDVYVPAVRHPSYEHFKQYAWLVIGNSMNRIAKPGSYVIGVDFFDLRRGAQHDDLVVCRRQDGDKFEYTLKRVRVTHEGTWLVPESDDPRHQEPIWYSNGQADSEAIEVKTTHLIIGSFSFLV